MELKMIYDFLEETRKGNRSAWLANTIQRYFPEVIVDNFFINNEEKTN